ncbi:hypothetical protein SAMN05444365_12113 [Micromonospora pattaloongensis]|uniref:Uncharacterized protein n=1 Tax=Micromonospora pattaloongensis TaxID=405436 RepID=A0A1H3TA01_9ACTN|nr:hypothetical protein SAMN05444365_12113 [Micromonospora pattaloongensis]
MRLADGAVLSFRMAGVAEDKCSYEDVWLFEHENVGGERLRFSLCAGHHHDTRRPIPRRCNTRHGLAHHPG